MKMKMLLKCLAFALALPCLAHAGEGPRGPWEMTKGPGDREILKAAYEGDLSAVEAYLVKGGKPDLSNRYGMTMLSMAAEQNRTAVMQALLKAGADVNAKAVGQQTPIYWAARENHIPAMKLLIDAREIRDYPETLRAIELKEEDIFLSPEAKTDLAQRMVMGSEYYASKEIIRTKLKTALDNLDDQMARARQETSGQMVQELSVVRAVVIVLVLVLVLLIVLTARLSTLPLLRAVDSVRQQKEIPAAGSKEFRLLAESYNELARSCRSENKT